jgi:hypothetical protein
VQSLGGEAVSLDAPEQWRQHGAAAADLVGVLAQLAQPRVAAALANPRPRFDHPLARQMLGEGLACRALAGEGHHVGGLGDGLLGGDLVLSRRTLSSSKASAI